VWHSHKSPLNRHNLFSGTENSVFLRLLGNCILVGGPSSQFGGRMELGVGCGIRVKARRNRHTVSVGTVTLSLSDDEQDVCQF